MANNIVLAQKYVSLLDEVYRLASLTGDLESDASLARAGANTNEIVVPKLSMDGLADYSRNSGYVNGDVSLTWETVRFNYERGRSFTVDVMDDEETQNVAFGSLAGEFIRTRVAPEIDAFRFATLAGTPGIGTADAAVLTSGAEVIAAIRAGVTALNEAEVPPEARFLYITPTLLGLVRDMDTTKSREVLDGFARVIEVPQSRFYTAVKLNDGTTDGEQGGGFVKADGAANINFLIVHKGAVLQFTKHAAPKIIAPENNPDADAYKYGYRVYGLEDVYENKAAGIYLHCSTT